MIAKRTLGLEIRELFPQLKRIVRGKPLIYLDSAATALKPLPVIEAVTQSLSHGTANVHRGAHFLSDEATENFEAVREKVKRFIGAQSPDEIVFTHGTTSGINLLARVLGHSRVDEGDEIILSQMEHHSNIVPWQMIAVEKKAVVRFLPVTAEGELDFTAFEKMLSPRVKVVSLVHLSNALGTVNRLAELFSLTRTRARDAVCVVDAAQSISRLPVDVKVLDCDFLVFSGHKMFAPPGVGVLYGKKAWLEKLPPYQGGGSMISEVSEEGSTYLSPPHRFEAGTPPISQVMGLGAAVDFVCGLGLSRIQEHERAILRLAQEGLRSIAGVRLIGILSPETERAHLISFLVEKSHPSDVGALLDEQGIAVRAGHHCCQPLMRRLEIPGTVRASFSVYTTEQDVSEFLGAVKKAKELLA